MVLKACDNAPVITVWHVFSTVFQRLKKKDERNYTLPSVTVPVF
jgi:hypothetical protein